MEELCPLRGGGERGALVGLGGFGRSPFPSAQENLSSSPPSFFFFFSLSPPLCNSLPSPNATLSSLLLHNQPKVLLLDSRWSDSEVPSPRAPSPCPGPGQEVWVHLFWPALCMTLETKLTMAEAGWLGSSSAKRWQALSVEIGRAHV